MIGHPTLHIPYVWALTTPHGTIHLFTTRSEGRNWQRTLGGVLAQVSPNKPPRVDVGRGKPGSVPEWSEFYAVRITL